MKQLKMYSIPATLESTVTVYAKPSAKPEMATAAESAIHNSFIRNELTFCKSTPVLFIHTQIDMSG